VEYRILGRTDIRVSILGFGASPLGNEFGPIDVKKAKRAVRRAIEGGINLFDVSPYYGRTLAEERLGEALDGRDKKWFWQPSADATICMYSISRGPASEVA
jgi:L-galactose dehydrogenase